METNKKRFNRGTRFGDGLIRHSIQELGCGRSILVDKDGIVLCGNDVYRITKELGKKIIVVETDGDVLVVVKRTDLSAKEKRGMEMSLVDNLSQERNLDWDTNNVRSSMGDVLSFDPRKWGGDGCMVEELKLEDLFKDSAIPKCKKMSDEEFVINRQLTLFD